MSSAKNSQEPQTRNATVAYNHTEGSSFESEDLSGHVLDFAHSELEATHRNYDSERKHRTQTLLIDKGIRLLAWALGIFVYWLLFHDSVHGILQALIEALSCRLCQA